MSGSACRNMLLGSITKRFLASFNGKSVCQVSQLAVKVVSILVIHSSFHVFITIPRFYGGYDRLNDGSGARALQDLSGGIVQSYVILYVILYYIILIVINCPQFQTRSAGPIPNLPSLKFRRTSQ